MLKNLLCLLILSVCHIFSYAQVDTVIGLDAPNNVSKDYRELAHYLCDNLPGEKEKANAIYNWITHNIKYDVKAVEKGHLKSPDVGKVIKTRRAICGGYSQLFTEMCREAGLKAMSIDGYAKDWMFDNGDKFYLPRHGWSAVLINGKWELADPTWGAGGLVQAPNWWRKILNKVLRNKIAYSKHLKFEFEYNPAYFMQNPQVFLLKHLPTDRYGNWQTAPCPLLFLRQATVR